LASIVAPLKPKEETENDLLIQPSKVEPKDTERQLIVKLPLRDFLCNKTNGRLTRWGVIVAQDGEGNGIDFCCCCCCCCSSPDIL
jgi:hypothetical protein